MVDERILDLINRDIDNVTTPEEHAWLHTFLAGNPESKLVYDELLQLSTNLTQVGEIKPPEYLRTIIINQFLAREPETTPSNQQTFSLFIQEALMALNGFLTGKKAAYLVGAVAVAVVVIAYYAWQKPAPTTDESQGTIGGAKKYRSEQMTEKDVLLAGQTKRDEITAEAFTKLDSKKQLAAYEALGSQAILSASDRLDAAAKVAAVVEMDDRSRLEAIKDMPVSAKEAFYNSLGSSVKILAADRLPEIAKLPIEERFDRFDKLEPTKRIEAFDGVESDKMIRELKKLPSTVYEGTMDNFTPEAKIEAWSSLQDKTRLSAIAKVEPSTIVKAFEHLDVASKVEAFKRLDPKVRAETFDALSKEEKIVNFTKMDPKLKLSAMEQLGDRAKAEATLQFGTEIQRTVFKNIDKNVASDVINKLDPTVVKRIASDVVTNPSASVDEKVKTLLEMSPEKKQKIFEKHLEPLEITSILSKVPETARADGFDNLPDDLKLEAFAKLPDNNKHDFIKKMPYETRASFLEKMKPTDQLELWKQPRITKEKPPAPEIPAPEITKTNPDGSVPDDGSQNLKTSGKGK